MSYLEESRAADRERMLPVLDALIARGARQDLAEMMVELGLDEYRGFRLKLLPAKVGLRPGAQAWMAEHYPGKKPWQIVRDRLRKGQGMPEVFEVGPLVVRAREVSRGST